MRLATLLLLIAALSAPARADEPPKLDLAKGVHFVGRTEATVVQIRPRVNGLVERVLVKSGDAVSKGDILAELDDRLYKAELKRAKARLAAALADAKLAAVDLARIKAAAGAGTATKEELTKAEVGRDKADALVEVAKAEVEIAELNLSYTKLTAPIAGRASRVSATAGELVPADGPALLSVVADPIAVTFEVDERIALEVRRAVAAGGKAVVEIGLSNEDGYPHKAALDAIDLRVERATGTIRFRATLANPTDVFGHGFFVRVRLTVQPGK